MNESTEWVRFDALSVGDQLVHPDSTVLEVVAIDGIWIDVVDAAGRGQSLYTHGSALVRRVIPAASSTHASAPQQTPKENPMSTITTTKPKATGEQLEGRLQVGIMLAIGLAGAAASFTHVHDVAAAHGQADWLAWADAIVLELMSVASGLEMRRRKRAHQSTRMPFFVLLVAVCLSLSAQILEAESTAIGWIAASVPALGFLAMAKMALGRKLPAEPASVAVSAPAAVPAPFVAAPVTSPAPVVVATIAPRPAVAATPARTTRPTVTASVPTVPVNPRTGKPYSERHQRRLAAGK